jgi:hypothetical protein
MGITLGRTVVTENSNPDKLMMEAARDRNRPDIADGLAAAEQLSVVKT